MNNDVSNVLKLSVSLIVIGLILKGSHPFWGSILILFGVLLTIITIIGSINIAKDNKNSSLDTSYSEDQVLTNSSSKYISERYQSSSDISDDYRYTFSSVGVVGMRYLSDEDKPFLKLLRVDDSVLLDWDRDNEYDSHAVVVQDISGHKIGYLPQDDTSKEMVIDWLKRGDAFNAQIKNISYDDDGEIRSIKLRINFQ